MLKVICAFLFLGDNDFSFKNDDRFGWLKSFTSAEDVDSVCEEIRKEFSVLGADGIINRYRSVDTHDQTTIEEITTDESAESRSPEQDDYSYTELKQIIGSYISDEASFGKKLDTIPTLLQKDLKKDFPRLNFDTLLYGSKVGNGYLLFSTYAMYVKDNSRSSNSYVRIPYKSIIKDKFATAAGRIKGTRKLMIVSTDKDGKEKATTIDDNRLV